MDLTVYVDVVIGLTVVYLSASIYVTIINEYIAQIWKRRAKQLGRDLNKLIDDTTIVESLTQNPALAPFFTDGQIGSSYIDTKVLAQQLIGGLTTTTTAVMGMARIVTAIGELKRDSNIKNHLMALSKTAADDVEKFTQSVSVWIDSSLTMLGETYKRNTQKWSFCIGFIMAIACNLNTVTIVDHLYRDKETRQKISAYGSNFIESVTTETFTKCQATAVAANIQKDPICKEVDELRESLFSGEATFAKIPIGWSEGFSLSSFKQAFSVTTVLGWLLTALAVSLGASFWFDLLKQLINIRHGLKRPVIAPTDPKATP